METHRCETMPENRAIIFHHDDADGRCAAAIMAAHLTELWCSPVEFHSINYKDKVPTDIITQHDVVALVDFSFKPDDMERVRAAASRVIWCDHHVTAKDYGYNDLSGYRDFSDGGLAGCECTWRWCHPDKPIPPGIMLLGDYDSWRMAHAPACVHLHEGLKLEDQDPASPNSVWGRLIQGDYAPIIAAGEYACRYRNNYCRNILESNSYHTVIGKTHSYDAVAVNLYGFGSAAFGDLFGRVPVCIAYIHDGRQFTVSLYSKMVDVGAIAKEYGGGGHKGAAGFVCETLPFAWR